MNYIKITHQDIANGPGVRSVLWVSGCSHQCPGCQNPETWDCHAGQPMDISALMEIINDLRSPYREGITFSGGDPLFPENRGVVGAIAEICKEMFQDKTSWLYTGYLWEDIKDLPFIKYLDVIVDGKFDQAKYSIALRWKGSSNQRVIDVQKSLAAGEVILWEEPNCNRAGDTYQRSEHIE